MKLFLLKSLVNNAYASLLGCSTEGDCGYLAGCKSETLIFFPFDMFRLLGLLKTLVILMDNVRLTLFVFT